MNLNFTRLNRSAVTHAQVEKVVGAIAGCDFKVAASRGSNNFAPWILTVSEDNWCRHLVVNYVSGDGERVNLLVLSEQQSGCPVTNIDISDSVQEITLADLVEEGYLGAKRILGPATTA